MRGRLVLNPKSGTDRALDFLPLIHARLREIVEDLDVTITTGPSDVVHAAARAAADGCDAFFVAGGDGTLNIALRGLSDVDGLGRFPIGMIPFGTGNDFSRALGLSEDPEVALERLVEQRTVRVDVGMVNDRPFVNTSAGGFVADVSNVVTEGLKDATGKLAYVIAGARALLGSEPFSALVERLPEPLAWGGGVELQMFAVCNARTIGGGYPIAPAAQIDDGLLDGFFVRRLPALEFIGVLQRIAAGQHEHDERVLHVRAAAFDLRFDRTVRVNTDGELLEAASCRYSVRHRGATFFCGPTPDTVHAPTPSHDVREAPG